MYTQSFHTMSEQLRKVTEPYMRFNKIFAERVGELTQLNLDSLNVRSEMATATLKSWSEVNDFASLGNLAGRQMENVAKLTQRNIDDCLRLNEIANAFRNDLESALAETSSKANAL